MTSFRPLGDDPTALFEAASVRLGADEEDPEARAYVVARAAPGVQRCQYPRLHSALESVGSVASNGDRVLVFGAVEATQRFRACAA